MTHRRRLLLTVSVAMVAAWLLAWAGFAFARSTQVTPERIARTLRSTRFAGLSAAERLHVIRKIAAMLNRLSPEDRRAVRLNPDFNQWFRELEDGEKGAFLELTVPTGFNQMLTAFEQMPEDRRRRAIADSVRRLREARERMAVDGTASDAAGTNQPPELSPELQEKMVTLGLKSFYETGSPDLKAELAPVVGELQQAMEAGRGLRMRRRPPE
ncbi:MAG: hypothetical protein RIS76_3265 [Verrucomicrobiota bacterium]